MAGILRRTIFLAKGSDGFHRFSDWARVNTSIGQMMEPFTMRDSGVPKSEDKSWRDPEFRIDDVQVYDPMSQRFDEGATGGPLTIVNGY